ncbi:hypothetical protein [Pseudocitrobacter cyperus]|uniref:Uncharacterized protein n=1 Tax=Pseudocitrobacter cyperus TaxID=3112843 RepID=A0ABV0HDR4_9ENTR
MKSSEKKLADTLIGEAVISIIQDKKPITSPALLNKLNAMLGRELDSVRLQILQNIIHEITALTAAKERDFSSHNEISQQQHGNKKFH